MISCFELTKVEKIVSPMVRLIYDNQLSIVLTKLETIHKKLIRLDMVGPINIKINWIHIIGIIVNVMNVIFQTVRMLTIIQNPEIEDMVTLLFTNIL